MKVFVRFMAFDQALPGAFTEVTLADHANVADLLKAVDEIWGHPVGRKENGCFAADALVASDGQTLRIQEPLYDGQKITLVGQILGG